MSTNSITTTIESDVCARGLAIIITNDYYDCTSLSSLPGTFIDGGNMKDTFLDLQFVVHWERNVNQLQFTKLIHEACNFQDYHKFKKYKCIVFVFSGHGDLGDIVYLQDGLGVSIGEDIIKTFLPKASPNMGKYQKLFFFDACRGKQESESVMVPRCGKAKGGHDDSPAFEHRGGSVIDRIRVPGEGGFLVAYSTMSNHLAWEGSKGGAWLQKLAEEIRTNTTSSIEDVLTKVNSDLIKDPTRRVQQPEKLSRLNELVFLHPEKDPQAPPKVKIAAVFPTQPTSSLDRTQPLNSSIQSVLLNASPFVYQGAVDSPAMKQLISQYPSAAIRKLEDYPHNPPEHENITYYRSQVTITLSHHQDVVGDSKQYFFDAQISREEAIKDAILQISLKETSSGYPGLSYQPQQVDYLESPIQQSAATPCLAYDTSFRAPNPNSLLVSQQGHDQELSPPANYPRSPTIPGHYRQRVNRFFQENNSNPDYTFDSKTGPTQHRCIVRYTIQGESREVDSLRYYLSKGDAKEQVAKLVLERENVSQIVSKGITPPSNKVWKSKLKEYCDKNKTVFTMMPVYCTKSSGNGFKSTVTFLGRDIEGEECKSKQEAEQSAARNALRSVQLN